LLENKVNLIQEEKSNSIDWV